MILPNLQNIHGNAGKPGLGCQSFNTDQCDRVRTDRQKSEGEQMDTKKTD